MQPTATTAISIPADSLEPAQSLIDFQSNRSWIPWAWAVLARAGEVPTAVIDEDVDYPSHLVTLAGLGHFFERFQQIIAGGDADLEPGIDLVGDVRPGISTIELARYCEREGIFDLRDPETAAGLTLEAIKSRATELQRRLIELLGGGRLFTSLYVAGGHAPDDAGSGENSPAELTDDAFDTYLDSVVNEHLTQNKQRTYAWLEGDLDLG
ncbi:hypothetical protein [Brachybacterium paraconglomeratum]|uniref:hypothetical protein n=1 Tax=Brachybacterium paraconglomeratum TaxID=173362 RepID=UPI002490ADD2|nr:hypothetical protein [Brachybacterium paraconglomeratum]